MKECPGTTGGISKIYISENGSMLIDMFLHSEREEYEKAQKCKELLSGATWTEYNFNNK